MKQLCSIKPKNENNLFSQSFRKVQKKLKLLSSSDVFENCKPQLHDIPLNMVQSNGVSPLIKKKYLTFFHQKGKSFKGTKPISPFNKKVYCIPSSSLKLPKSISFIDTNYQALSGLKRTSSHFPQNNNQVEIYSKDLYAFHNIVYKLNDNDFHEIGKNVMQPISLLAQSMSHNHQNICIRNYYFQNVIDYIKREIDYRNQLNQSMSEDEVYQLLKKEFCIIKANFIQRIKMKYIDEYNKKLNPVLEKSLMKSFSIKEESSNVSTKDYKSLLERITNRRTGKQEIFEEFDLTQYVKTSIDECIITQPTKKAKMKEFFINNNNNCNYCLNENEANNQMNEGWHSERNPNTVFQKVMKPFINAQTQTKQKVKDEIALQIREHYTSEKNKKKKNNKLYNNKTDNKEIIDENPLNIQDKKENINNNVSDTLNKDNLIQSGILLSALFKKGTPKKNQSKKSNASKPIETNEVATQEKDKDKKQTNKDTIQNREYTLLDVIQKHKKQKNLKHKNASNTIINPHSLNLTGIRLSPSLTHHIKEIKQKNVKNRLAIKR